MGVLPKTLFAGAENISEADKQKIFVNNFSESIESVLRDFNWDGKLVGTIGLTISDDGKKIENGRFIPRGPLEAKTIKMAASTIWPDADETVILAIKLTKVEVFKFSEGGLYSQYVDEGAISHTLHSMVEGKTPIPILPQEKGDWNVGSFCLRLICHISKASTAKGGIVLNWTVLIFPRAKEQLLQASDMTASPSWPGLRLITGEMALWPRPTTTWMCPVLPLLRSNSDENRTPSGQALRHAIGAIMEKSARPDIMTDIQHLNTRWNEIAENPLAFADKPSPICWPKQAEPEADTGKCFSFSPIKNEMPI